MGWYSWMKDEKNRVMEDVEILYAYKWAVDL